MSAAALEAVSEATFDARVLEADGPVLVDLWAPWCGTCRLLAPVLADLAVSNDGRLQVVAVDADAEPQLAERLGAMGLPTLVLFAGGQERLRLTGAQSRATLAGALSPWLTPDGSAVCPPQ